MEKLRIRQLVGSMRSRVSWTGLLFAVLASTSPAHSGKNLSVAEPTSQGIAAVPTAPQNTPSEPDERDGRSLLPDGAPVQLAPADPRATAVEGQNDLIEVIQPPKR